MKQYSLLVITNDYVCVGLGFFTSLPVSFQNRACLIGIFEGEKMTLRYRGEQIHRKIMMENKASRRKEICKRRVQSPLLSFSFPGWESATSIFSEHHSFFHSKAKKYYCSKSLYFPLQHQPQNFPEFSLDQNHMWGRGQNELHSKKISCFFLAKCVSFMQLPCTRGSDKALAGELLRQWDKQGEGCLAEACPFFCMPTHWSVYFLLTN